MGAPQYCLFYWPTIPGRGEFVRLAFEAVKHPYTEVNDVPTLMQHTGPQSAKFGGVPEFAVPVLEVSAAASAHTPFYLSQTPAILSYLAPILGLDGSDASRPQEEVHHLVLQLALTALDLSDEAHNVHHPLCVASASAN